MKLKILYIILLIIIGLFQYCISAYAKPLWKDFPDHELLTHMKTERGIQYYYGAFTSLGLTSGITVLVKDGYLIKVIHYTECPTEQEIIDGYNDFLHEWTNSSTVKMNGKLWFRSEFKDFYITVHGKGKTMTIITDFK